MSSNNAIPSNRQLAKNQLFKQIWCEFKRGNADEAQRLLTWLETLEGMSDQEFQDRFKEENDQF